MLARYQTKYSLLKPILLSLFGLFLNFYIFSPGFLSPDSLMQYNQAKSKLFSDAHPPVMSVFWSLFFVFPNPISAFLLFQLSLLWTAIGIFFFLEAKNGGGKKAYLFYLLPILPYISNFSGVIWKDVQMAYSLLLAVALIRLIDSNFFPKYRNILLFLIFLLFVYAINIRVNGIFAVLPLVVYLLSRYKKNTGLILVTIISIFVTLFGYIFVNTILPKIFSVAKTNTLNVYFVDDLFQYSVKNSLSLLPTVSMDVINACKDEVVGNSKLSLKIFCINPKENFDYSLIPTSTFFNSWREEIISDPKFYVKFRYSVFMNFLSSPLRSPYYIWQDRISPNDVGLTFKQKTITDIFEKYIFISSDNFKYLFQPYFWLLLIPVLSFGFRNKKVKITLEKMLLLSSVLYLVSYFPVVASADYRYIYWVSLSMTYLSIVKIISNSNIRIS